VDPQEKKIYDKFKNMNFSLANPIIEHPDEHLASKSSLISTAQPRPVSSNRKFRDSKRAGSNFTAGSLPVTSFSNRLGH
jgi:hypothetical protein